MRSLSHQKGRAKTEDIIRILCNSKGLRVDDLCREHGISAPTYHRWKKQYGDLSLNEVQRLKEPESDQLKRIVADQLLHIKALEIALERTPQPGMPTQCSAAYKMVTALG